MFTPSTMDVISGYSGSDDEDDDKKLKIKKVQPLPSPVIPEGKELYFNKNTRLLKGWESTRHPDTDERVYYKAGTFVGFNEMLTEDQYQEEIDRVTTKIKPGSITQSDEDDLGARLVQQTGAAVHNLHVNHPRFTGLLAGTANFMAGIGEDLKQSATNPNEKDLGKRLLGSFLITEDKIIQQSAKGAEMWATGGDIFNPWTKEKIGSLPDLDIDPTLAGVVGGAAAGIVTGNITDKGLNQLTKLKNLTPPPGGDLSYATVGVNSRGLLAESAQIAQKTDGPLVSNVFYSIDKTNPAYKKWRTEGESIVTAKVAAGETENLGKGLTHYVDKNTGTRYRLGTRYKDGKVQYTNIDLDKRGVRDLKRATSIELDDQTLFNLFKGNQKTVESYKAVNKTVIKKLQEAISEHNIVNNLKGANKLTLEHVFDVQHYGRLGEALPPFSGKGADELFNLTILGKRANISSGAKARYMDSGEALIKAVKDGTFIDYHQTTSDFIKHNLAEKVNNMTTKDWKRFTDLAIANPSTNAHTLLVNFK